MKYKRLFKMITNKKDIYEVLKADGFYDVSLLVEKDYLTQQTYKSVKDRFISDGVIWIWFSENKLNDDRMNEFVYTAGTKGRYYSNYVLDYLFSGDQDVSCFTDFLNILHNEVLPEMDKLMDDNGYVVHYDYSKRCSSCHYFMNQDEEICKLCGKRRGEGPFRPWRMVKDGTTHWAMNVYRWKCKRCGHTWPEWGIAINDHDNRFCEICDGEGVIVDSWTDDSLC